MVNLPDGFAFGEHSLGMIDFFPHYVEGLRTQSPFWRVITYYKIARFYYTGLRNKFNKLRNLHGLPIKDPRVLDPHNVFDAVAHDLVGKRYTDIVDSLRADYRNVFAHFSTDESMSPLNAEDEDRAARASVVLKKIATDAIADARSDITELVAGGVSGEDIYAAIAATNETNKGQ